ncbi:GNAT family N-acetyltransferase [Georgenia alba]|uniref:GNAT family N-acetyltransferase n=1 Tax=Georgenia alba TaxID=2233858 RepID=A0ABW2QCE3_9MICO
MSSAYPGTGHAHDRPDVSVRPALPEDAATLGDVHARTLRATLAAGVGHDLGDAVARAIDAVALAEQWSAAITAPPSPRHRVLTALDGARVVGFAAFAPAEVPVDVRGDGGEGPGGGADASREPEPGDVAEILALEVPAAEGRRGHGSRLLAACADLLRQQGTGRVQAWVVQADEARTRFLAQAGFAPAGLRRTLDVAGEEVAEVCWYADL